MKYKEELRIKSMLELNYEYRAFIKKYGDTCLDLSKWLPSLKHHMRPVFPGELVAIMADTGVGKSMVSQVIALIARPLNVLFFELELPGTLMFERYMQNVHQKSGQEVEDHYKDEKTLIADEADHIYTCDNSSMDADRIIEAVALLKSKAGIIPEVLIVDYIGLMSGTGGSRYERISSIAEDLKRVARITNTATVMTTQVHRMKDGGPTTELSLHDAKDSGSIESSAGVVLSLWRDEEDSHGTLKVKICKNTKGMGGGIILCNLKGEHMIVNEKFSQIHKELDDMQKGGDVEDFTDDELF